MLTKISVFTSVIILENLKIRLHLKIPDPCLKTIPRYLLIEVSNFNWFIPLCTKSSVKFRLASNKIKDRQEETTTRSSDYVYKWNVFYCSFAEEILVSAKPIILLLQTNYFGWVEDDVSLKKCIMMYLCNSA